MATAVQFGKESVIGIDSFNNFMIDLELESEIKIRSSRRSLSDGEVFTSSYFEFDSEADLFTVLSSQ